LDEGRNAKIASEKQSGLYFPNPVWMQFGTFEILTELWKQRKSELKSAIEINKGLVAKRQSTLLAQIKSKEEPLKAEMTSADIIRDKERRRLLKIEKLRQLTLNTEMESEEKRCRIFYKWELGENLRERRLMREAEKYNKEILLAEKRLKEEAEKAAKFAAGKKGNSRLNATNGASSSVPAKDTSKLTQQQREALAYEKRRQELKDITMARRREKEEEAYMTLEDKLSEELRDIDRKDRAKAKLLKEYGEDAVKLMEAEGGGGSGLLNENDAMPIDFPEWFVIPKIWDEWNLKTQKQYVNFMIEVHDRNSKVQNKANRINYMMEKLEDKSYKDWEVHTSIAKQQEMEAELAVMISEEETKAAEAALLDLHENMRKIMIFCREKGEEELKAKTELRKKEELARRRTKELKEATEWYKLCLKREKIRNNLARKITESTKTIDTQTINGFHQRFATENLRKRLYEDYFRTIAFSIANKAETISAERKIFFIQEKLSINKRVLTERITSMKTLWKDIQRDDLMRIRKSILNEKFFPKHRHNVLKQRFGSWVRFFYWNRGFREAYELKYEILKRQMDIQRQFKTQLLGQDRQQMAEEEKQYSKNFIPTIMAKHRARPVQCKTCSVMYLEAQNHSMVHTYSHTHSPSHSLTH